MGRKKVEEKMGEAGEVCLADHSFTDEQIAAINEAKLEPAQVRNEFGLVKIGKTKPLNAGDKGLPFSEGLARAVAKYKTPAVQSPTVVEVPVEAVETPTETVESPSEAVKAPVEEGKE